MVKLSGPSVGQTFATSSAPYVQYLDALSDRWREAEHLRSLVQPLLECVDSNAELRPSDLVAVDDAVVEILDLKYRPFSTPNDATAGGGGNEIAFGSRISSVQLRRWRIDPRPIDSFVENFNKCSPDTHTRIIVLQSGGKEHYDGTLGSLFLCHVLGMELDLRPADINTLLELGCSSTGPDSRRHTALKPGFFSFSTPLERVPSSIGAYLGLRLVGHGSPDVVVIRLYRSMKLEKDWHTGCTEELWAPPKPSTWRASPDVSANRLKKYALTLFFWRALRSRVLSAKPLVPRSPDWTQVHRGLRSATSQQCDWRGPQTPPQSNGTSSVSSCESATYASDPFAPCGHWLSGLLSMQTLLYTTEIESLTLSWPRICEKGTAAQQRDHWLRLRQLSMVVQSGIDQVDALQRDIPGLPEDDYESALRIHCRLLGAARSKADEVKDIIDSKIQLKSLEVSEMSINESRSAIAVTVLAFVFIPINLASSVFGMNVQQINSTGHDIWTFCVTSLVLLVVSGLAWFSWQASCNWRMVYNAAREHHGRNWPFRKRHRWAKTVEKFKRSEVRGWRRYAAYLGLRSMRDNARHPWTEDDIRMEAWEEDNIG